MPIKKGLRPSVDIDKIQAHACESAKIRIKLRPQLETVFSHGRNKKDKNGYVKTGHGNIDSAFRRIRGKNCRHNIDPLYQKSANSNSFLHRHREWGFHLWEEIELEPGASFLEAIKHLSTLGEIEFAEPIYKKKMNISPNDEWYSLGYQWALKNTGQYDINYGEYIGQTGISGWDIGIEAAWAIETGNPEVIVAVIDEGVDFNHPDLAMNIWPEIGPQGINTVVGEHGTHVAGIIAAVTNNGQGMSGIAGGRGTGGVKIMSLDLWGEHGLTTDQLFIYAADNGAAISQNSWGYETPETYSELDLDGIDYFNMYGGGSRLNGGITIFAAGNSNSNEHWWPACYKHDSPESVGVIAVAAHDNRGLKANFSNYGDWIDITAPGVNILSLMTGGVGQWLDGTSMACPHVSGVAALILSNLNTKITNTQLRSLLVRNTKDIYATNPSYIGQLGGGALDAFKALKAAQTYQPAKAKDKLIARGDRKIIIMDGKAVFFRV